MHVALHVHDQQVQRSFAVVDVALADQYFRGMVVDVAVVGEARADQAAEAASDDRVLDAVRAGDGFD